MTAPTAAEASTLVLPVTVPLSGVQRAANAQVPLELARVDQTQSFLGGLLSVQIAGTVTRTGAVSVQPAPDGDALVVRLPIRAAFRATPAGAGAVLAREFGGAATVSVRVTPFVKTDWNAGVKVSSDYTWTDPLSVELAQGVKVSVQSLVDAQVRAQLQKITVDVEKAVREGARLRQRAGTLWARVQQPWTLPTPEALKGGAYALVQPQLLSVTPFRFTPDALKVSVGAALDLKAGLGRAPAVTSRPLPALNVTPTLTPGVDLRVPVRLPFTELSAAATRYAAAQAFPLPVTTSPTLRVTDVTLKAAGTKLHAVVALRVDGLLGLKVPATVDVTGTPTLGADGHTLTLNGVSVATRREGLTGRVIGWLADARAQAFVARAAHVDLAPHLARAQAQIQARLPFSPVPGVALSGKVGALRLGALRVTPEGLVATAEASGQVNVTVDAGAIGGGR